MQSVSKTTLLSRFVYRIVLLCFVSFVFFASALPNYICSAQTDDGWSRLTDGQFIIYFSHRDSSYATQALQALRTAFDEISFDLKTKPLQPITVFICASKRIFEEFTLGKLPKWTGGFANINENSMIIKSPSWDRSQKDFTGTLVHELTHLLLHAAVSYRPVPRWIDEGLAIFYSREREWASASQISKALLTKSIIPLSDIDRVLTFHQEKAKLAYQESYTAVQYLLATYDIEAIHTIIEGIRGGWSIDNIFRQATGSSFPEFEAEWRKHIEKEYRWYFIVDFDSYLWFAIIGLFILGFVVIRLRNRRVLKQWQEEEEEELEENQG